MVFSGERSGDQSLPTEYEGDTFGKLLMKGGGGEGGEGHKTITESFRGDQVNFIVTDPRSSVIPLI